MHLNNQIRMSLKSLCELMKLDPAPVLGEDIQKMVQGSKYRFDFANDTSNCKRSQGEDPAGI